MTEKILIIDDDVQTLRLVGLMLERQGFKILAASTGIQALQMAQTECPDAILLDVMMPDLDGYEVTRRLRKMKETAETPILIFTARSQVEDKITGYEAGVDDYLTKPVHPAELTAHLRALLSRKSRNVQTAGLKSGYTIGVVAAKGGLGVSSLVLNLAIALYQKTKLEVIAAETRPGQGSWNTELGLTDTSGLGHLLRLRPSDITLSSVGNELIRTAYGVRLLTASPLNNETALMQNTSQLEAVVDVLPLLAQTVLFDIGTNFIPGYEMLLNHCQELLVVTDPLPSTIRRTRLLIEHLATLSFGKSKRMKVIFVNRLRADVQLSILQIQELLGQSIAQVIPPAPELAFQAANRCMPLIQVHIGSTLSLQYSNLAELLIEQVMV